MPTRRARSCRTLLALVLGVCGALAWAGTSPATAAASCRTGDSCVLVQIYENGAKTDEVEVSAADLAAWSDVGSGAPYRTRDRAGGPAYDEDLPAATSLVEFVNRIGAADGPIPGLSVANIRSATVPRAEGRSFVVLDPFDPTGRFESGLLPAVYPIGGRQAFIRPLLRDDPDDVNRPDLFFAKAGQPLIVRLNKSGRTLTPIITTDRTSIEPGESVKFDVSVAEQTSATLSYRWTFGVGDPATIRDPLHPYDTGGRAGTYRAQVEVTGDDGSAGQASVTITVTRPDLLGPVISVADPDEEREVGDAFQLAVRFTNPGTPDSYAWYADGEVISRRAAPPRHAFETKGRHVFQLEIDVDGRIEKSKQLVVTVGEDPPRGTGGSANPPATEPPDGANGNGDPDAPVTGPEDGDGTQTGTQQPDDAPTTPVDPGEPVPPGGLTGILLAGAATPADAVPLPESQTATDEARAVDAAAARPSTEAGGAGRTIRWGLGVVPLLLLVGVAREAGWVSRLRSTWARRS